MDQKQLRFYCQIGNLKQIREGLDILTAERRIEALRLVFQSSLRAEVLEYLGAELLRLPHELVAPLLVDLLYSEEAATRNMAIELFPAVGAEAMAVLAHHLNDLDTDVRLFTVQALVQMQSQQDILRLLRSQLTVEKDLNILTVMVETIGDLGNHEDVESIQILMEQYTHPYFQFVAQRSLMRLGVRTEVLDAP